MSYDLNLEENKTIDNLLSKPSAEKTYLSEILCVNAKERQRVREGKRVIKGVGKRHQSLRENSLHSQALYA